MGELAGDDNVERTLVPGQYRALYAFELEGTAETVLEEDQIVRVVGRGGGVVLRYCRNVRPTWVKFNSKDTKESVRGSEY